MEVQNFIMTLEQYLRDGQMRIRADDYGKHSFPYWIDQLLYILTTKHKFREPQFKMLLAELKKNGFSRIPTLNIKFSLGGYLAIKNKQENTGDHIDIMRICIGLISSDIFLRISSANQKYMHWDWIPCTIRVFFQVQNRIYKNFWRC